jgi:excisionase family DNA binding protein
MTEFLSTRQAAELCGVSERSIRNWVENGRLSATRVGRALRIPREQLHSLQRPSAQAARHLASVVRTEEEHGTWETRGTAGSYPISELIVLVREAQAEAIIKAEAAARWQARAEVLAGELEEWRARAQELIEQLAAACAQTCARDDLSQRSREVGQNLPDRAPGSRLSCPHQSWLLSLGRRSGEDTEVIREDAASRAAAGPPSR